MHEKVPKNSYLYDDGDGGGGGGGGGTGGNGGGDYDAHLFCRSVKIVIK